MRQVKSTVKTHSLFHDCGKNGNFLRETEIGDQSVTPRKSREVSFLEVG